MTNIRNLSIPAPHMKVLGSVAAIAIPVGVFLALRQLSGPLHVFQFVSIQFQTPEQEAAQFEELYRARSELNLRIHIAMIALTLCALSLLWVLFTRSGIKRWRKYLLTMAGAASVAACWLQW